MSMRGMNGGFADMSLEQRQRLANEANEKRWSMTRDWPETVQHEGQPDSYIEATEEWARRMDAHKQRFNPTGTAPQVQDAGHIQWGN